MKRVYIKRGWQKHPDVQPVTSLFNPQSWGERLLFSSGSHFLSSRIELPYWTPPGIMAWGGFSGKLLPVWAFCSLPRLGQQEEKQESQLSALLLLLFYFYFSIQGYTQSFLKLFYGVCVCSVWCACMLTCIDLRKYMSQHMCTKAQMPWSEDNLIFQLIWNRFSCLLLCGIG